MSLARATNTLAAIAKTGRTVSKGFGGAKTKDETAAVGVKMSHLGRTAGQFRSSIGLRDGHDGRSARRLNTDFAYGSQCQDDRQNNDNKPEETRPQP